MCGIFALLLRTKTFDKRFIIKNFDKIKYRGPDNSNLICWNNFTMGFHRLCINDLNNGDQPFVINRIALICNGEIYNHRDLALKYNINNISSSDCEIIIHLYQLIGIENLIKELDGVFSFILYDEPNDVLYLGRDRIGVRPLFYSIDKDFNVSVASEAKAIMEFNIGEPTQLLGSNFCKITKNSCEVIRYYNWPDINNYNMDTIIQNIRDKLEQSVIKRLMSDREIGCLLSGGVDSSVIASILAKEMHTRGKQLKTFSIGFEGSTDIKYARKVAEYIKSDHYEFIINYKSAIKYIPNVIYALESYDITTVRASVGMYLLSKYIKEGFNETVIFSGEGADEVLAGYLYFHYAPTTDELFEECKRRVNELPFYDVLRADRCTSHFGLELRVPFLDKDFLEFCMSLSGEERQPQFEIEKFYLRKAFENYIPNDVLWRRKEGFSDGVSGLEKPWYKYIQEWIYDNNIVTDQEMEGKDFPSKEAYYYYKIYHKTFDFTPIPRYWMPKWMNVNDPSGRILPVFDK